MEAPGRTERPPASGDQAASTGQSSAAAGIVSSKPESGQQGKAPTPPLLTPTKQERPITAGSTVLPVDGQVAAAGARGGPRDKPMAGVSADKDAAWPAEELPSGAEHAQPAEASPAGLVKQRQPTAAAAAAAGRPAAAAAVPSSPAGRSVLSPSSKVSMQAPLQGSPVPEPRGPISLRAARLCRQQTAGMTTVSVPLFSARRVAKQRNGRKSRAAWWPLRRRPHPRRPAAQGAALRGVQATSAQKSSSACSSPPGPNQLKSPMLHLPAGGALTGRDGRADRPSTQRHSQDSALG